MDLSAELGRLIPRWHEAPTRTHADRLVGFLQGLGRKDYEDAIRQLPARLTHHRETVVNDENAWYEYIQVVCFRAVADYSIHVPAGRVLKLLASKQGLGRDLYSLAMMLSETNRKRLPDEIIKREVVAAERRLQAYFNQDRVGIIDYAIELMIGRLNEDIGRKRAQVLLGQRAAGDDQWTGAQAEEYKLLRALQTRRRNTATRLPKEPRTTNEIRFLVEEVSRELFHYESGSVKNAKELIGRVLAWYPTSQFFRSTRKHTQVYLLETGFIANLDEIRFRLDNATYAPNWRYYIEGPLRSEKFWDDISGLNHDVPMESTEAGQRGALYERAALMGGLIFAGLLVLPVAIQLTIAAPGATVRFVAWTGGRLRLATQYAYTSFKFYGLIGGSVKMARDGYQYYMQNALVINQRIIDLSELALDLFNGGTGAAPGSSLADRTREVSRKMATISRRGLKGIADTVVGPQPRAPDTTVEYVKLVLKDADSKDYEVTAKIIGLQDDLVRLKIVEKTAVTAPLDDRARRTITFLGTPKPVDAVQDVRGTARTAAQTGDAAKDEVKAARSAANDNVPTPDVVVDDLARQRQKSAALKQAEAKKQAENLAQKQDLASIGERRVVNEGGAVNTHMGRGANREGDVAVGTYTPPNAGGRTGTGRTARGTDRSDFPTNVKDQAKRADLRSVPAWTSEELSGVVRSPAGYLIVDDEALLKMLGKYRFKRTGLVAPKSGGGKYQKLEVTSSDHEWTVVSPSGVEAKLDGIALDEHVRGKFIVVEAKATFVEDIGRSAHIRFYPDKVEQLARQLVICLESNGKLRLEIVTNARQAAEAYMNMTVQQVAREVRKRFGAQIRAYASQQKNIAIKRLSAADLDQIIEDNVTIVVSEWGTLSKSPRAKTKGLADG